MIKRKRKLSINDESQGKSRWKQLLNDVTSRWRLPFKRSEREAWSLLLEKIETPPDPDISFVDKLKLEFSEILNREVWKNWSLLSLFGIVLLMGIVVGLSYWSQNSIQITGMSKQQTVVNVHDVTVKIAPETELEYRREHVKDEIIEVRLLGQALFETAKDEVTLYINTYYGPLLFTGKKLHVWADYNSFRLDCIEGELNGQQLSGTTLTTGQSVHLRANGILSEVYESNLTQVLGWEVGVPYYEDISLEVLGKYMQKETDWELQLPEKVKDLRFTGTLNYNHMPQSMVEALSELDLCFELVGKNTVEVQDCSLKK
ncbi:hypothetical protein [Algivirga pacifica]|uniref:FecR protein domain-containing protein n=1 Tax=Algivirga pacifica TaxID=1162670 RepID=A0ABP9D6D9_9BACT